MPTKTLRQQRTHVLDTAQDLLDAAKSAGRPLTDAERAQVHAAMKQADELTAKIKQVDADAELHQRVGRALAPDISGAAPGSAARRFSAKSLAKGFADKIASPQSGDYSAGRKALAPSGTVIAGPGLVDPAPVPLGRPATSLLSLIPAKQVTSPPTVSFLRQTTRNNAAAVVEKGATKPTSTYGLTRVDGVLRTIATLSDPIDKFDLADNADVQTWLEQELGYGLDLAVESALLNGTDGADGPMTGILNTSGVQAQAFDTDVFQTLRVAQTKLDVAGVQQAVVAMHPNDWQALCLTRVTGSNEFISTDALRLSMGSSGDPSTASTPFAPTVLASWGMAVVLSLALTPGQAVVFDPTAVELDVDAGVTVEWNSASGFASNEVIARCEGRFASVVRQPFGIVVTDVAA